MPSDSLKDIEKFLSIKYQGRNSNAHKISFIWTLQSIDSLSAKVQLNFKDPL